MPKIWFRKSKKAYYLQIDRHTQMRLGRTLAEAEAAYRAWLLEQGQELPRQERRKLTVAELAQEFLDRARATKRPKTYEHYCYFVVPFVERFGPAPAASVPQDGPGDRQTDESACTAKTPWRGGRRHPVATRLGR